MKKCENILDLNTNTQPLALVALVVVVVVGVTSPSSRY